MLRMNSKNLALCKKNTCLDEIVKCGIMLLKHMFRINSQNLA